jgi:sulfur-carrier protein
LIAKGKRGDFRGGQEAGPEKKTLEKDLTFLKKMLKKKEGTKVGVGSLMRIEVKLFANFREFLPPGADGYSVFLEVEAGTTIGQVLEILRIPESIPMLILVNGIHRKFEDAMQPDDVLSLFPPVAGG